MVPACLVAVAGWSGPFLCQKKDLFRKNFCSGFVISAVTCQSTLAGMKGRSAPVSPCPALSLPLASDPEQSKHLESLSSSPLLAQGRKKIVRGPCIILPGPALALRTLVLR